MRVLQFKEQLMAAMGLNTEEEGSPMAFFRRGYRVSPSPPAFEGLMVLGLRDLRSKGLRVRIPRMIRRGVASFTLLANCICDLLNATFYLVFAT